MLFLCLGSWVWGFIGTSFIPHFRWIFFCIKTGQSAPKCGRVNQGKDGFECCGPYLDPSPRKRATGPCPKFSQSVLWNLNQIRTHHIFTLSIFIFNLPTLLFCLTVPPQCLDGGCGSVDKVRGNVLFSRGSDACVSFPSVPIVGTLRWWHWTFAGVTRDAGYKPGGPQLSIDQSQYSQWNGLGLENSDGCRPFTSCSNRLSTDLCVQWNVHHQQSSWSGSLRWL